MIELAELTSEHYDALYQICIENTPFAANFIPTLYHFRTVAVGYEGLVLQNEGKTIGAITFSELKPLCDACMNIDVSKEYWGRWVNRRVLRAIAEYGFETLKLPRISSYSVKGVAIPNVEDMLARMNFRVEGIREDAILYPDGYHDIVLYGLLKRRCKWILG